VTAPRSDPGSEERPVRVQTRFERFPTSIKGAFVMAGADGNPHAIRIEDAQVVRVPGGPVKPIPLEDRQLDVAPSRDLFVPFEVGVMDLEPGWYQLVSSVRVDGGRMWTFEGRPFTIPWARNDVRRGVLPVGKKASTGGIQFEVDRVELTADAAIVVWRVAGRASDEGAEPTASAVLMADGQELSAVPPVPGSRAFEPRQPGELRSVSYPVPRSARTLEVVIRPNRGKASAPVPVSLL
jgi:hypothetical protein